MNPPDVQSDPEPEYFDPEEADMSEQKFLASLEAEASRPEFVLDDAGGLSQEVKLGPSRLDGPNGSAAAEAPSLEIHGQFAGQPSSSPTSVANGGGLPDGDPRPCDTLPENPRGTSDDWRSVVSAKVNRYKARRPQQERYPSLSLPFDPGPYRPPAPATSKAANVPHLPDPVPEITERDAPLAEPVAQVIPVMPPPPARIVLESTARVLEFPKPPTLWNDELAEPVVDRPRIVEAPELVPPPPAMGGILIEPPARPEPERKLGFDIPLQSASLGRRIVAGMCDSAVVAGALALFGYISFRLTGPVPPWRTALPWAVVVLALLWAGYQYAFLVFTKSTPGLRVARLRVSRFDGTAASRQVIRWRVITSLVSCAALGLGYAWCFLDEDQLSWHDRITHTHLAPKANIDSAR